MNYKRKHLIDNWQSIASLILLATLIVSVQRCNTERSERLRMKAEMSRQETIAKIETRRREIAEREKKYPPIDRRLKEITASKGTTKKEVFNEVKKADVNRLADMFREKGYNCVAVGVE